ncbi:hypothetical protein TcasGA2_TC032928 [Tribolium castaneum]|uniref:Uncharacterized protein n=1 Tax=Tribolium castaneum TaxID=7070 RepID=A0A139WJS6_TRICA|nr:hypothetical protein TcasGA2_TC032928 [Tribolium castaneum]
MSGFGDQPDYFRQQQDVSYNFEMPPQQDFQQELNFQSFEGKPNVSGNIYESNPYLNPSVPYSGDVYGGSGQGPAYDGTGGEFEDEPPLLEELGINPEFIVQKVSQKSCLYFWEIEN